MCGGKRGQKDSLFKGTALEFKAALAKAKEAMKTTKTKKAKK